MTNNPGPAKPKQAWPQKHPYPFLDTGSPWEGGDNDGARLPPVEMPEPPPKE